MYLHFLLYDKFGLAHTSTEDLARGCASIHSGLMPLWTGEGPVDVCVVVGGLDVVDAMLDELVGGTGPIP